MEATYQHQKESWQQSFHDASTPKMRFGIALLHKDSYFSSATRLKYSSIKWRYSCRTRSPPPPGNANSAFFGVVNSSMLAATDSGGSGADWDLRSLRPPPLLRWLGRVESGPKMATCVCPPAWPDWPLKPALIPAPRAGREPGLKPLANCCSVLPRAVFRVIFRRSSHSAWASPPALLHSPTMAFISS